MIDYGIANKIAEPARPSISARTIRVLTLTPFYPNSENSAEGCFIAEVLPWTQHLGISNEVMGVRPAHRTRVGRIPSEIPSELKRFLCVPGNPGLPTAGGWLAWSLADVVERMHRDRRIDLIHAHAALPCGDAAERLSRKYGIPFVVSVHGLDVFSERQAGRIFGRWCRQVSEPVYRRARIVICISDQIRRCVADLNPKACVVYNGVDTEIFSRGAEQESPLVVLSVGNLITSKGHALLLRAFSRALEAVPDCRLEIIGDGPERSSLARLAEQLGIANRVDFIGRQDRQSVAEAMRRCAIFALPSSYEGLGCVYLEAMACAKPAIGCEGQGIAEIIQHGNNGMLVPPESEEGLTQALQVLLHNQDFRQRLGTAARDTIVREHTFQHQAKQLEAIYRECVA